MSTIYTLRAKLVVKAIGALTPHDREYYAEKYPMARYVVVTDPLGTVMAICDHETEANQALVKLNAVMAADKSLRWTVWWYEEEKFSGRQLRHNQDFKTEFATQIFRAEKLREKGIGSEIYYHCDLIKNCPWHPSHA